MAAGDEAAAAGLSVVPATADVRQGYAAINTRGDELARHQTSGTHPFTRITGQVAAAQLPDGIVSTAKIASGAVSTPKLADGAATTAKLGDRAVTVAKLARRYASGIASVPMNGSRTVTHGLGALSGAAAVVVTPSSPDVRVAAHAASPTTVVIYARTDGVVTSPAQVSWLVMEVD